MNQRSVFLLIALLLSMGFIGLANADAAQELECSSHRDAPAFPQSSGRWFLRAEVLHDSFLKKAVLSNQSHSELGSTTDQVRSTRRIHDVRAFRLQQDVSCKYDLTFPQSFSKLVRFQVILDMTCDDMYDGHTVLNCRLR